MSGAQMAIHSGELVVSVLALLGRVIQQELSLFELGEGKKKPLPNYHRNPLSAGGS